LASDVFLDDLGEFPRLIRGVATTNAPVWFEKARKDAQRQSRWILMRLVLTSLVFAVTLLIA
jgi:hypothetical protein